MPVIQNTTNSDNLQPINIQNFSLALGGGGFIKISVLPANQSAISPLRENILQYDADESVITPVTVTADN